MGTPITETPPVTTSDELSLRDVYLVLRRSGRFIAIFTAATAAIVLAVCLLMPKTFVSKVTLSLSANTSSLGGSSITGQLLNNLPSLPGLAEGFSNLLQTTALTKELGEEDPEERYKVLFDTKKGLLTLTAKGGTAREAFDNVVKLSAVAKNYFTTRAVGVIVTNIDSLISRSRIDLVNTKENLRLLQIELKKTPNETRTLDSILPITGANGQAGGALSARGISPAYSTLSVQEATLRTGLAQSQSLIEALEPFKRDPRELEKLVGQALQLQELTPAAEALRADQPRPVLYTALAGVLGLLLSTIWVFVSEALRDPKGVKSKTEPTAVSGVPALE
jgi:hypothetical protein